MLQKIVCPYRCKKREKKSGLTKTFAKVCLLVNEDFGRDDSSEWQECLHQILVAELLRQVVDEQVRSVRA